MRILAIYIFRSDGIPLISRFYDDNAKTIDGLVAPFLVSTINRMEEITGSGMHEIGLRDNLFLFMEQFAGIIAAVVVNERGETSLQLDLVVRRFYKKFHKELTGRGWTGKIDKFENFFPEIEELLGINSEFAIHKMPKEILDSFVMAEFDKEGQVVIRELIKQGELTNTEIYEMVGGEKGAEILAELREQELIGIKHHTDGSVIYFT